MEELRAELKQGVFAAAVDFADFHGLQVATIVDAMMSSLSALGSSRQPPPTPEILVSVDEKKSKPKKGVILALIYSSVLF